MSETLDRAVVVPRRSLTRATVAVPHAEAGRIDNVLRDWVRHHDAVLGEPVYGAAAAFELWVPAAERSRLRADLAAVTAGAVDPVFGEERIVDVRPD